MSVREEALNGSAGVPIIGAPPAEHVQRMEAEYHELKDRTGRLETFINDNPTFGTLNDTNKALMLAQLGAMQSYLFILSLRINAAINGRL